MSSKSKRLIFSARDAGSAGHVAALVAEFAIRDIETTIIAEEAAQVYFETSRVPYMAADVWLSSTSTLEEPADAVVMAIERLTQIGASAVVCGRSSSQVNGIDEIVITAARLLSIPSFVIQDFWGDVWAEELHPDHYFVIDELAASLTRERTAADVHVIGSPKHAQYSYIDFQDLRKKGRIALGIGPEASTIGYFGQDLLGVHGYHQVLQDIGEALTQMHGIAFLYKPHPRESKASQSQSLKLLRESGANPVVAENLTVEAAIATADVVLSCFSTVALDSAFMMHASELINVSIVCADYPEDVSDLWRPATGLVEFPLVTHGIALAAGDRLSLTKALHLSLTPAEQKRQGAACRSNLTNPGAAINRAYELITRIIKS